MARSPSGAEAWGSHNREVLRSVTIGKKVFTSGDYIHDYERQITGQIYRINRRSGHKTLPAKIVIYIVHDGLFDYTYTEFVRAVQRGKLIKINMRRYTT